MKIINILMKMVILKQLAKRVSRPKGPKATDAFIDFSPCGRTLKVAFPLTLAPSGVDLKVRPANFVSASALRCAIDLSPYGRRPNGCQPIYELL